MCIQIQNTGGKFSQKLKFIAKFFRKTETFRENHTGNKIFAKRKFSRKQKCSRKLSRRQFAREKNFSRNEISRKVSEFSYFAKMEKGVFFSTLILRLFYKIHFSKFSAGTGGNEMPKTQNATTEQYICEETFVIELGQQGYKKSSFCVDSKNAKLP
jgi:hypothetical protein